MTTSLRNLGLFVCLSLLAMPATVHADNSEATTEVAAKRGMPNFYLAHNLTFAPSPLALHNDGYGECGQRLGDAVGMELNFDYRIWYFFLGSHIAISGDIWTMREYALRVGGMLPLGERFSLVGAAWLGTSHIETTSLDWDSDYAYDTDREEAGLLLGASIGARFMVARWFGLTADLSLSTAIWTDNDSSDPELQINRLQAHTGVLFAW
ncbi:MAG: hypothetical protein JRF33_09180 [Deltaproteobacteria bacterium]|nr:hypothetical protein [Deltaproteobacteria bacterium]